MGKIIRPGLLRAIPNIDWRSFGFRGRPSDKHFDKLVRDGGFGIALAGARPSTLYRAELVRVSDGKVVDLRTGHNVVPREGAKNLMALAFNAQAQPSWFVGIIKQQATTTATTTASSGSITLGTSQTTQTGQQITIFGAGTSGANYIGTISAGATGTAQTVTPVTPTAVTAQTCILGPTFATTDTIASHANWTEIAGSDVTDANRLA